MAIPVLLRLLLHDGVEASLGNFVMFTSFDYLTFRWRHGTLRDVFGLREFGFSIGGYILLYRFSMAGLASISFLVFVLF